MKFFDKLFSKIIGPEMDDYLDIVNAPDKVSIDRVKEVIKNMEKRYKSIIGQIMKTHYPEIQKLYTILAEKLEQEGLCKDAINSYEKAIELDGYPPLTKEAKKKLKDLKEAGHT